jgi:transcriptional regulator with XRE-family HTH domain
MNRYQIHYPLLGKYIDQMIHSLATTQYITMKKRMREAMHDVASRTGYSPDTVYRWRKGQIRPSDAVLEVLARLGYEKANLDRTWGEHLLQSAHYPKADELILDIWGPKDILVVPHNLPPRDYPAFVGRQEELRRLLELLSRNHTTHWITVDGIGGVGKTTLVLEAAYRCLYASTGEVPDRKVPTFDAIVFVSAKHQLLTPFGILARSQAQRTLAEIFRGIADALKQHDITRAIPENQPELVRQAVARQRTLLIVDNLETIENKQEILGFLYDLPAAKVVLTTRERAMYAPIRLNELSMDDSLTLISQEAEDKQVSLTDDEALALYQKVKGIPAALVFSIGQRADGHSVATILERLTQSTGDLARFTFEESVTPLRGNPAHHLFLARAFFPTSPTGKALARVSGLSADPIAVDEGLAQLQRLSLVEQREGRYHMLHLTREYALAELASYPEFERQARQRWVDWYLEFSQEHGGRDWKEWHIEYDQLEEEWENILAVLDWCAANGDYATIRTFWGDEFLLEQEEHLLEFANIYGYWDDRLMWLDWLTQEAERRGDWPTVVSMICNMGWSLAWMGRPESLDEAHKLLKRAWDLRDYVKIALQLDLARNIAVVHIRSKEYFEADRWLNLSEDLLSKATLEKKEYLRLWLQLPYYRGIALYERSQNEGGDLNRNYQQAEKLFRQMLIAAEEIAWQRAAIYAQNWLADIAIKRGRLSEAESLLQTGLPVAVRNKDKRRIAHFKRSWAYLEQARGDLNEACRWVDDAHEEFKRLGMQQEVDEMRNLLQDLGCQTVTKR